MFSSSDNTDKLWVIKEKDNDITIEEVKEFTSNHGLSCYDFSSDGKHFIIGTDEGGLVLYDLLIMQKILYNDAEGLAPFTSISFSPDGNFISSIDSNKGAKLYEIDWMTPSMIKNQKDNQNNNKSSDKENLIIPRRLKDKYDESSESEEPKVDDFAHLDEPVIAKITGLQALEETFKTGKVSKRPNAYIKDLSFSADAKFI